MHDTLFAHVDINSYFATLLQQENPALRGRPIGVVKSTGRTCLIAASKEAKEYGVKTGDRLYDARKLCPHIITVPAHFEMYLHATQTLYALFRSLVPTVEIFSLDEAFLDLSDCRSLYPSLEEFGKHVQQKIKTSLGEWVTCNIGIAHSRILAKIASEHFSKGSVTLVTDETETNLLAEAPFREVCGIGRRLEKRLLSLGITNTLQILFADPALLEATLGHHYAREVLKIARGEDPDLLLRINNDKSQQAVSRSITGYTLCHDDTTIRRILLNLCMEIGEKARKLHLAGRTIGLFLSGEDQHFAGRFTLATPTNNTLTLFNILMQYVYEPWQRPFGVIKFGVYLSKLTHPLLPLLPSDQKQETVEKIVDAINQRFGMFTIKPATLLGQGVIKPEVTGYFSDKKLYLGQS